MTGEEGTGGEEEEGEEVGDRTRRIGLLKTRKKRRSRKMRERKRLKGKRTEEEAGEAEEEEEVIGEEGREGEILGEEEAISIMSILAMILSFLLYLECK
mmetsp:Transcript_31543/g.5697  ORF Transcript_31543/g.5697 Transcript_31543/m.5697 type:complete len:99 (+) Transcript_31543:572-868(+)